MGILAGSKHQSPGQTNLQIVASLGYGLENREPLLRSQTDLQDKRSQVIHRCRPLTSVLKHKATRIMLIGAFRGQSVKD
jgi:hypothetical protein